MQAARTKIPRVCEPCYLNEDQCLEHRIFHDDKFDEEKDLVLIRSTAEFCVDKSFLNQCYLVKYAGIPVICNKCNLDFLHHNCYHIDFHEACKFCRINKYKIYAENVSELKADIEKHNCLSTL